MAKRQRDVAKEQFWRATIKGQEQSRLSIRDYCDDRDLPEASFYHWRHSLRLRDRGTQRHRHRQAGEPKHTVGRGRPAAFIPVRIVAEPQSRPANAETPIEIVMTNGRRLRIQGGFERQTLLDAIAALESLGC